MNITKTNMCLLIINSKFGNHCGVQLYFIDVSVKKNLFYCKNVKYYYLANNSFNLGID